MAEVACDHHMRDVCGSSGGKVGWSVSAQGAQDENAVMYTTLTDKYPECFVHRLDCASDDENVRSPCACASHMPRAMQSFCVRQYITGHVHHVQCSNRDLPQESNTNKNPTHHGKSCCVPRRWHCGPRLESRLRARRGSCSGLRTRSGPSLTSYFCKGGNGRPLAIG